MLASLLVLVSPTGVPQVLDAPIVLKVDTAKVLCNISPYIYGSNENDWAKSGKYLTFGRQGGNRMTAYNWENNASNAGGDWHNQNDDFLGGGNTPGEVPRKAVADALDNQKTFLVTVPLLGYVAADKFADGDVNKTPNYLEKRFRKSLPKKGAKFQYPPDLTDDSVYQDEFVWWLEKAFPVRSETSHIWYSLDNEPDIWSGTHSRIHPQKGTYAEIVQKSVSMAKAIKAVAPKTLIFGPASYGWAGYTHFQDAPDANGRDFLETYLSEMQEASKDAGKRLVDVLDLHWYPEARGDNKRIVEPDSTPGIAKARMQATRSLWDPTYVEDSWITQSLGNKPINLIPLIMSKIAKSSPGTKLAFTEYQYGGQNHISGAIAQADTLGIFGREGVYAAALWPYAGEAAFVHAGFDAFRNYDGNGAQFGDVALGATSSDPAHVSIYASKFSHKNGKVVLVIVNQYGGARSCQLSMASPGKQTRQYSVTQESPKIHIQHFADLKDTGFALNLPAMSVNVLEIEE